MPDGVVVATRFGRLTGAAIAGLVVGARGAFVALRRYAIDSRRRRAPRG